VSAPDALIAGRYRLVRRVGAGAMGVVWEALDERLHRPVALKELHSQPGLSEDEAELVKNRAMREARITARLNHPNAVPVFDVVEHDGQPCLIMQFLPSTPLSVVLKERKAMPPVEAAEIGAQVGAALAAAHQVGIVHRDVKPGNILIAENGAARISDFGISHALGDATLTSTGLVHGTPAYLAPEVARGVDSSFASDVFGLGATLYAMTEGAPPFGTDQNSIALLYKVASGNFNPPVNSGALTPVMLKMLATDPHERPSMAEAAQSLADVASGKTATPATLALTPDVTNALADAAPQVELPVAESSVAVAPQPRASSPPRPPTSSPPQQSSSGAAGWENWRTSELSAGSGGPASPRPRRGLVRAILVVAGLLCVAVVVALVLPSVNRGGARSAASTPAVTASQQQTPSASVSAGKSVPPSPSRTSSSAPPSANRSATASSSATSTKTVSSSPPQVTGAATAAELAGAITSYYALMPGDTAQGWTRLTAAYKRQHAGGRTSYLRFWNAIDRVSVSNVTGNPPDQARATITYFYRNGRVVRERTAFGLAKQGGALKIAASSVLSNSTQ
jgi:serine/threonine protein kinase